MKTKKKYNYLRKTVKSKRCSPSSPYNYTCFNSRSILKLRDYWNIRHPDKLIKTNNIKLIWKQLNRYLSRVCNNESCWLRQQFIKNNLDKNLLEYTFAPTAPQSWKLNKNEWLNSLDIINVMNQLEKTFNNFEFIGPSPIDFDKHKMDGECIWEDLCTFNLINLIKKGKNKIGIIFNIDPHYKSGSHWVALYIDIINSKIIYWDSVAEKIPGEITRLIKRIMHQGKRINVNFEYTKNNIEHQRKNTECGIYSIYFIESMLRSNNPTLFTKRIPDEEIENLRTIYFNHS